MKRVFVVAILAAVVLPIPAICLAAEWTCPKCKTQNTVTQNPNICKKCGANANINVDCPKCKKKVKLDAKFCPHCGNKMPDLKLPPSGSNLDKDEKEKSKTKPKAKTNTKKTKAKPKSKPAKSDDDEKDTDDEEDDEEPVMDEKTAKRVAKMVDYYVDMYSKHLASRDWFVRSLAVVALSRINAEPTTAKLMEVLRTDKDPLVKLYAWEALHARVRSLDKTRHRQWVALGVEAAYKGAFRGDLRVPLIKTLAGYGPKAQGFEVSPEKLILYFLKTTNHKNPRDSRTLKALRKLVAKWQDPELIKKIAAKMTKTGIANRAEYILGGLNSDIEPIGAIDKEVKTSEWVKARGDWNKWLKEANLTPPKAGSLKMYRSKSTLIPPAEKIKDPDDPKWRKDLELEKLRVNNFDLVFCIDSTASMQAVMDWVAKDVIKMMTAFNMVARELRIGTVYFRHEEDPAVMQDCCRAAGKGKKIRYVKRPGEKSKSNKEMTRIKLRPGEKLYTAENYRTKIFKLTANIRALAKQMSGQEAIGGHDNPPAQRKRPAAAVYSGLGLAIKKQPWTISKSSKKIIVLVGDSPPTAGTMAHIEKMMQSAEKKSIIVHAIKVVLVKQLVPQSQLLQWRGLAEFDKIAKFGQGRSIVAQSKVSKNPDADPNKGKRIAAPPRGHSNYKLIVGEIIRSMLPEGYRDRVDPLVNVLLEYSDAIPAKNRSQR